MSGKYLEGVWMVGVSRVSGLDTLEDGWIVYENCLYVCSVSGKCHEGV